jgi:NAD(P)-dependent dehydrogenase (short-subunit alcohol dehydrogenase family)
LPELEGRIALVTGGGRGIGADIARELASAGMHVGVSARTRDEVELVASEIGGLRIVADVSRRDDVEHMVDQVERSLGGISWSRMPASKRNPPTSGRLILPFKQ